MDGYDPWDALSEFAHARVVYAPLPPWRRGLIEFRTSTITLQQDLGEVEQRCTLAHELVHLERGPVLVRQTNREERIVAAIAAERLVPFERLREACRWTTDRHELADELGVDVRTVNVRLANLSESQREMLANQTSLAELSAIHVGWAAR